jgi:peptidoglycan/LPS O-acetylase OafA/YrhL
MVLSIGGVILGTSNLARSPVCHAVQLGTFYVAGMTVYCFRDLLRRSRLLTILCLASIVLSSVSQQLVMLALPSAGVYLLFRFVYADHVFAPSLRKKISDLSYGLYLYGWFIEQSLTAMLGAKALSEWPLATASIFVCLPRNSL